jgi:hypothetical protein
MPVPQWLLPVILSTGETRRVICKIAQRSVQQRPDKSYRASGVADIGELLYQVAAMFRQLLATRPLLVHAAVGAAASMGCTAVEARLPWPQGGLHDAAAAELAAVGDEADDALDTAAEYASSAVIGAMQGAAMRYWFPMVEAAAATLAAGRASRALLCMAMDAAPALASTYGAHWAAKQYYKRTYALPTDGLSLRKLLVEPALELQRAAEEAFDSARDAASRAAGLGSGSDGSGGLGRAGSRSQPVEVEVELELNVSDDQLALIDLILETEPTPANTITPAVTVANFSLVPRHLRGIVGTLQWRVYETLSMWWFERRNAAAVFAAADAVVAESVADGDDAEEDDDDADADEEEDGGDGERSTHGKGQGQPRGSQQRPPGAGAAGRTRV